MTIKLILIYLMIAMALMIVYFWTHQKNKRRMSKRALVLFGLAMLLIITFMALG